MGEKGCISKLGVWTEEGLSGGGEMRKSFMDSHNCYWIGNHIYFARYKNGKFTFWIDVGKKHFLLSVFIWVLGINFLKREI